MEQVDNGTLLVEEEEEREDRESTPEDADSAVISIVAAEETEAEPEVMDELDTESVDGARTRVELFAIWAKAPVDSTVAESSRFLSCILVFAFFLWVFFISGSFSGILNSDFLGPCFFCFFCEKLSVTLVY